MRLASVLLTKRTIIEKPPEWSTWKGNLYLQRMVFNRVEIGIRSAITHHIHVVINNSEVYEVPLYNY